MKTSKPRSKMCVVFTLTLLFSASLAHAQKKEGVGAFLFHKLVEGKPLPITRIGPDSKLNPDGFALYREGEGGYDQYRKLVCDVGVTEMYVLSGNGDEYEGNYKNQLATDPLPCPHGDKSKGLEVKFGQTKDDIQETKTPLTTPFLKKFDQWVNEAKASNKKIAFRCNCGCHRTGRLAGYADMRFFGATPEQALAHMKDAFNSDREGVRGKFLAKKYAHHSLTQQIYTLNDYILQKPCSTDPEFCVDFQAGKKVKGRILAETHPLDHFDDLYSPPNPTQQLKDTLNSWGKKESSRCFNPDFPDLPE